jgi:hypothetical protein
MRRSVESRTASVKLRSSRRISSTRLPLGRLQGDGGEVGDRRGELLVLERPLARSADVLVADDADEAPWSRMGASIIDVMPWGLR